MFLVVFFFVSNFGLKKLPWFIKKSQVNRNKEIKEEKNLREGNFTNNPGKVVRLNNYIIEKEQGVGVNGRG